MIHCTVMRSLLCFLYLYLSVMRRKLVCMYLRMMGSIHVPIHTHTRTHTHTQHYCYCAPMQYFLVSHGDTSQQLYGVCTSLQLYGVCTSLQLYGVCMPAPPFPSTQINLLLCANAIPVQSSKILLMKKSKLINKIIIFL